MAQNYELGFFVFFEDFQITTRRLKVLLVHQPQRKNAPLNFQLLAIKCGTVIFFERLN